MEQSSPNRKPTTRIWRWLVCILILLISTSIAFILTRSSAYGFRFLHQSRLIYDWEAITPNSAGTEHFYRHTFYVTKESINDIDSSASADLLASGWRSSQTLQGRWEYQNSAGDLLITFTPRSSGTVIYVRQFRSPSALDRGSVWLKNRLPFLSKKRNQGASFPDP